MTTNRSGMAFDEVRRDARGRVIPHPLATDAYEDETATDTAEACMQQVGQMLAALSPDENAKFYDMLRDALADNDGGLDGLRRATDEPSPFPGRPTPGGGLDPLDNNGAQDRRMAADRAIRRTAAAGRAARGFAQRFPNAARVGRL